MPDTRRQWWRSPLLWTFTSSLLLLVAVGGWLLTDPATSRSDALKTGGLAGGAIVALYALWLNDRRRRVEEGRQQVEQDRHALEMRKADQDRERISDERFAKSVELLGHDADQVRVGALHALAALARNRDGYTQTVLDVLCSYLRRPFTHERYTSGETGRNNGQTLPDKPEQELELQVRLTAQRLISDLLPAAGDPDAPAYDLDLTGAALEYFDLSGHRVGKLVLRYAGLYSSTNLSGCEFLGPVYFTGAGTAKGRLIGMFRCRQATFRERAWFSGTVFTELADFEDTRFDGLTAFKDARFAKDAIFTGATVGQSLDLRRTRFEGTAFLGFAATPHPVSLYQTTVNPEKEHQLPGGWGIETAANGNVRLTVVER
ncbi:pentapeptide repeat-containing protein [Amycolatopsis sp. H20-H5]|uniref:pentapeptide repeat-containing protein n=1 Tax=Amycolatopsis sp. H20-H5 TaxID=3046309 RepID=UPI002DB97A8B|nr:pentapeptide repeat-containing protein [Amycolatopsis sp. H20-H5]MEC3977044.1 pentapeptide repeat-containing protein [Amycolatopsis sp. H20-H5]